MLKLRFFTDEFENVSKEFLVIDKRLYLGLALHVLDTQLPFGLFWLSEFDGSIIV